MLIKRIDIYIFIIIISIYLVLTFKTLVFLLFPILIFFKYIKNQILYFNILILISLLIAFNNIQLAIQTLILFLYYYSVVNWLGIYWKRFLYVNSVFFVLYILLCFLNLDLFRGDILDILQFKERLWFNDNEISLNPNLIGILSAVAFIGAWLNKKISLCIFNFAFLLFSQSRAALLFLIIFLIFNLSKNIKNLILGLIAIFSTIYIISSSSNLNRLSDLDMNGRDERKEHAINFIEKNFPYGYSDVEMKWLSNNVGTVDNLYYVLFMKWGVLGIFVLAAFFMPLLKRVLDVNTVGIIFAILLYGLFEESFISNIMLLTLLGSFIFSLNRKGIN